MRSNCKIGDIVHAVDVRNSNMQCDNLLGLSMTKEFRPSTSNIVGTDLSKYKIVGFNQFAVDFMSAIRVHRMPIALNRTGYDIIVSPAYGVFAVNDENAVLPEYLMLWFRRPEFDRYADFKSDSAIRGGFDWTELCNTDIYLPTFSEQQKIVRDYQVISERIELLRKKNQIIFDFVMTFFRKKFEWCLHEEMNKAEGYVHLGDFIHVKHGFAFDSEDFSEGETSRILVSPGNFKIGGGFQNNKPKYYSEEAEYDDSYVLTENSLVVTMTDLSKNADTLGYPAIIPADSDVLYLHNQRVGLVQMINHILPEPFFFCLMCSQNYRNYIVATSSGTTVHHTSPERIEGYGFIFPNNAEDLKMLSHLFKIYRKDCDLYNSEMRSLKKLLSLVQLSIS